MPVLEFKIEGLSAKDASQGTLGCNCGRAQTRISHIYTGISTEGQKRILATKIPNLAPLWEMFKINRNLANQSQPNLT